MGRGPGVEVGDLAGPSHTEPCRPRKDWGFYTKSNRSPPEGLEEESVTRSDGQFKSPLQLPRGEWITGTQEGKAEGQRGSCFGFPSKMGCVPGREPGAAGGDSGSSLGVELIGLWDRLDVGVKERKKSRMTPSLGGLVYSSACNEY